MAASSVTVVGHRKPYSLAPGADCGGRQVTAAAPQFPLRGMSHVRAAVTGLPLLAVLRCTGDLVCFGRALLVRLPRALLHDVLSFWPGGLVSGLCLEAMVSLRRVVVVGG